jgi:hypothetical protein
MMPSRFRIERATLEDADGMLDCLPAAFEPYRAQYTPGAYEDTVMTADTVRQRIKGMTVLVARSDAGRIIGTIVTRGSEVGRVDFERSCGRRNFTGE